MASAELKPCSPCKDTPAARYQDATYGKGIRVYNTTLSKGERISYRCTVCGALK